MVTAFKEGCRALMLAGIFSPYCAARQRSAYLALFDVPATSAMPPRRRAARRYRAAAHVIFSISIRRAFPRSSAPLYHGTPLSHDDGPDVGEPDAAFLAPSWQKNSVADNKPLAFHERYISKFTFRFATMRHASPSAPCRPHAGSAARYTRDGSRARLRST